MDYIFHIIITILLYTMLAQSLAIVAGYANMISLCHAGFFGIGAYTTAILSTNYDTSILLNLPVAIIICVLIAGFIALIALRTVDDYFIVITLGIQIVFFTILNNWVSLTRGPYGIMGIPDIRIFGIEFSNNLSMLLIALFFTLLVMFLLRNLTKSPFGRVLKAIGEDEIYSASLGKNVFRFKIETFVVGAALAAIPGVLYAHYINFIDPRSFNIPESIFILSIVIIAGMRNLVRIFLVSAVLILIPEIFRFIGLPSTVSANISKIIYGSVIVLIIFNHGFDFSFRINRLIRGRGISDSEFIKE